MRRMTVKMAAASEIALLLLFCCFVISATDAQATCDMYAVAGENFMVPLKSHRLSETEKLKWRHRQSIIVDRRPAKDGKVVKHKFVKGSKDDVYQNGSLKLTKVNKDHVGIYIPEVFMENGTLVPHLENLHLCVMDRVPKPQVLTECQPTTVKFTCSVAQMPDVNFEWLQDNQALKNKKSQILILDAKNLGTQSVSCKVFNRVSSLTSDPVTDPCHKPTFVFPKKVMGLSIWIFVGGGGGVVLVLIVVVIVCCVRAKRKKRLRSKDEEELRLGWTNQESQQQQHQRPFQHHSHPPNHHHHHHHQQQPAGHTGPRQHCSKQHLDRQHPRGKDPGSGHPQPSPRRPAQNPGPTVHGSDEQPPPLPQPRKAAPRAQRV